MTKILTTLINEDIDYKYSRIHEQFIIHSSFLRRYVVVPTGFVHDYESVPIIKGTSKRGGVIHDYLCRIDSEPIVTKKQAASVYLEIMKHCKTSWWRRRLKWLAVSIASNYFHKHKVMATIEEMRE